MYIKKSQNKSHVNKTEDDPCTGEPLGRNLCIYHNACPSQHLPDPEKYSVTWVFRVIA